MEIRNKKKVGILSIAALAGITIIGSSVAYFTSTDTKDNLFTVGSVRTILHEDRWDDLADTDHNGYPRYGRRYHTEYKTIPKDPTIEEYRQEPCLGLSGGQSTDRKYHHRARGWLTESES